MTALLPRSLRARLILGAVIWIAIGVSAAGVFISALFRQHATALVDSEMHGHLEELGTLIDVNSDGAPELYRTLSDPRFSQAGSGYSWQVSRNGKPLIKSTSVSTDDPPIPDDTLSIGEMRRHVVRNGPETLIVWESLFLPDAKAEPLRLQINVDAAVVDAVFRTFNISLAVSLLLLAGALIAAAALQIGFGLQPMVRLKRALKAIRAGKETHLPRRVPLEVQPVVDDLNSLIDLNAQMVVRARAQAGNLAHALKTPLAVLTDEAFRLQTLGEEEAAQIILQQCQRMQRQIDYQIARARAAASRSVPGVNSLVLPAVNNIVTAMQRLHSEKAPRIEVEVDPQCVVLCDPMDLSEMLANLIDNACKWCSGRVVIGAMVDGYAGKAVIAVEDDGAGLPAGARDMVFQIGQRLDERVPGSGLGLPIVRDLAQLYGGEVELKDSALGGLYAALSLPCAV
jgi:signal transduction histidine kinase